MNSIIADVSIPPQLSLWTNVGKSIHLLLFIFQEQERESDVVTNSNLGSRPKPPRKDVTNACSRVFRVVHVDRDLCRFRNGHGARTRERTVSIDPAWSTISVVFGNSVKPQRYSLYHNLNSLPFSWNKLLRLPVLNNEPSTVHHPVHLNLMWTFLKFCLNILSQDLLSQRKQKGFTNNTASNV